MSIRASIAFRSSAQIAPENLETMSRVLYRVFGREAFHWTDAFVELVQPLEAACVLEAIESDLGIDFAESDFLYELYTTNLYWSLDYARGNFGLQLDWMKTLAIAFPTIAIFYYGGDAPETPWRSIRPAEFAELREIYIHRAATDAIGYDAELRAGR